MKTRCSSKYLCKFCQFFLYNILGAKYPSTPKSYTAIFILSFIIMFTITAVTFIINSTIIFVAFVVTETATRYGLWKKLFLEILQNSQKNTCARVSFLMKLQAKPATLLKKDSGTGVFLWILQNFQEHLFYRTPPGDCFWYKQENCPV